MREIKFRAWDGKRFYTFENNRWTLSYNDISGWVVSLNQHPVGKQEAIEVELQQYTGLKDKNGKEIYEGDIVECERLGKKHTCEVFWFPYEAKFGYRWHFVPSARKTWRGLQDDVEVIGNIYENPELLERKQHG